MHDDVAAHHKYNKKCRGVTDRSYMNFNMKGLRNNILEQTAASTDTLNIYGNRMSRRKMII
jgi:hypothetical protein